jgi:ABC-type bacteriocin/lantibiotic exporter with double-glycine peptidase domain
LASALVGYEGGGGLTAGEFLAFHVAYGTFIGAIVSVSNTVTHVLSIAVLRERARPILEATPEVTDRGADPGKLEGRVELRNVVFKYRDDGPVILREVNFRAEPGEFIALVGPSGSGKSTLFRLLLGFDTPLSGSVHFDGQDLSGLDIHAVRRQLGVVLQNGRVNAGSVFENVATGTNVTLTDAWNAARAAGFAEDVEAMPTGMHTMVSEGGTNLSGGQRQRLLIARALVHAPRVLLLDEATSALDNRTQAVVSESLGRLLETRIVIAHRLSTIWNADRIYVIDGGRVVQVGTFAELAREVGLFSRLIARQVS